ncbi:MAG: hypothetical protein CVU41_05450 [Chloroflexi bacterium HGW-Chloroflexi-3]|nr:MAG: hypothetical protein CVU41_05450 [Chloroflexi bacterium HGW-Chloroflexi-3]
MFRRIIALVLVGIFFINQPLVVLAQVDWLRNFSSIPIGGLGFIEFPNSAKSENPRFLLLGAKNQIWITKDAIWLTQFENINQDQLNEEFISTPQKKVNLKIVFPESNSTYQLKAENPLAGKVSYLIGANPSDWKTDLQTWGQLRYQNLYPGVDFVIWSNRDGFGWRYEVKTETAKKDYHLKVLNAEGLINTESKGKILTSIGELSLPPLTVAGMEVVTNHPLQEKSGSIALYPVNEVTNQQLMFDFSNQYTFGSFLGGSGRDKATDIALDTSGNIYLAGTTISADFSVTPEAYDTSFDLTDAFIVKIDPTVPELVYATFIGGSGTDEGASLSVENGIAYLVGETDSVDFPLDQVATQVDAFAIALNTEGNNLLYATLVGGSDDDRGYALDVENGSAYLTGITYSSDFPTTNDSRYKNGGDIFVTKLSSNGGVSYSTLLGGSSVDAGHSIAARSGIAWITGETSSNNFAGTLKGVTDIFVAKMTTAGLQDSVRLFGGRQDDRGYAIAMDDAGDIYVTGMTASSDFAVTEGSFGGVYDAFLLKLTSTSTLYSTFLGGTSTDRGAGITLDSLGGIVLTGNTQSSDFPVTSNAFQSTNAGNTDAFLTRFFLAGSDVGLRSFSTYLGGSDSDNGNSVVIDNSVFAYVAGNTSSPDFPVTADALYSMLSGTQDAFLSVMEVGPLPMISIQKTTNGLDADQPPGPYVYPSTPITWQYQVENLGEVLLTNVTVSDNKLGTISCPKNSLLAGESMTCNVNGTAVANQYSNMGTVTARTPYDTVIGDTDASHYFGAVPATALVKKTNAVVVDEPSGLYLEEGGNITWTYEVTNSGNVDLANVTVVDDNGTPGNSGDDVTVCTIATLAAGATDTTTCALTGNAVPGPYSNLAVVVGTPPGGLANVTDENVSHYFGSAPGISLVKKLNGSPTSSPGPYLLKDTTITWSYEVSNTGNVDLTYVSVVDDNGSPADPSDDRTACSGLTIIAGATNVSSCSLSDTGKSGYYHNIATVTGTPPVGSNVTATADGYYFGAEPIVTIEYFVNSDPADSSPGLYVLTGSTLSLDYVITNLGNVDLSGIAVTDAAGNTITCPFTSLLAGNSMTCTASMTALSGQQSVLATVTATPPSPLANIQDSDLVYYFGSSPSLSLDKQTNDQQGDSVPGVYLLAGSTVNWGYLVKNTGNVTLTGVTVVDDNGTPTNSADDRIPTGCNNITLSPAEEVSCKLSATAIEGQYTNIATATGNPPASLSQVNASDTSHYFGARLSINLVKQTNGEDAATTPGPLIAVGGAVNWIYSITNNSNVTVGFSIVDNPVVTITCAKNSLAAGENITCSASGTATAGQYTNTATVTATPPGALAVFESSDTSHYFGVITRIEIVKSTNGQDANTAPGPFIKIGDPVNWTYVIRNTGNVNLTNVTVIDDQDVAVTCPQTSLASQASMTCTASGTAVAGQYANIGSVTANPPTGFDPISDTDPSHYFGGDASIDIEKFTNGNDNSAAPGIYILVSDPVTWTYTIRNSGNVDLENIIVRDDRGTETLTDDYHCEITALAVGAEDTSTCSTSDIAYLGQYSNTAYVSGDVVNMDGQVFDQDSSFYFGADPGIQIIKKVNGEHANEPPGPYIPVGETVNFSYVISFVGDPYQLTSIEITDESGVIPTCPAGQLNGGEILTCESQATAGLGQQSDVVYVSATTWLDEDEPVELGVVTASDISPCFGYTLGIEVEKYTNGTDVSDPPGVELPIDSQVTWTYEVTNTSNVEISEVTVNDVPEGVINCPKDFLASSEKMVCSKTGIVQEGDYQNEASVTAVFSPTPEIAEPLTDTDRSYYHGIPAFKVFIPLLMR